MRDFERAGVNESILSLMPSIVGNKIFLRLLMVEFHFIATI